MNVFVELKDGNIGMVHYMPFDPVHGLGKTKEELEKGGIFVDSVPQPEERPGKSSMLKYSETDGLYYEYTNRPLTTEEQLGSLQDENADLMFQNAMQDMSIATLQDENAELMFAIANLQLGGI